MFSSEIQMRIGNGWYPVCRCNAYMADVLIHILRQSTDGTDDAPEYRIVEVGD